VFTRGGGFMGMLMGDIPPFRTKEKKARLAGQRAASPDARHLIAKFIPRPPPHLPITGS